MKVINSQHHTSSIKLCLIFGKLSNFSDYIKEIDDNVVLEQLLIDIGAANSKRESREFIKNNSISLNGSKVNDPLMVINKENALFNEYHLIRKGKKNYFLVKFK